MSCHLLSPEPLSASGRNAEKLNLSLPALQSKMKCDPEGYQRELDLLYSQFNSSLELFKQQAALSFSSISGIGADPTVAKDLGDRAMFLSHVAPFYPEKLADFPEKLAELLRSAARLPSGLRCHVTQALILLMNRQIVDIEDTLDLFMELQILGDRNLKKLAFSHVIQTIKKMNQKHKDGVKNGKLQKILFQLLQKDERIAKRSLVTLCDLHRRKVWFESRTADAICNACFHESSRIMISAISFLLDYEKIQDDDDDSDAPSSEDEATPKAVSLSKESVYKANHKGTIRSKKKKQAKLQRAVRSMKRQQRLSSKDSGSNYYSPLNHLKDAQGFAEKLFSKLQACNERFEVKMMMLKVIARTIGLHRLIVLNFYPYLQKYVQPHQRDITNLLAAAIQACHDMIPPDAVEPLFKQIVNQFVHDRSRTEAIAVGLNVIREICLRMPLLMTEELLQDLVLYKKSHEKAISAAARSLIALFRVVCPSLLIKKDRGRPTNPKAKPKAYGEVTIASDVPDLELLLEDDGDSNESTFSETDDDMRVGADDDGESNLCSDDSEDEVEEENGSDEDGDGINSADDGINSADEDEDEVEVGEDEEEGGVDEDDGEDSEGEDDDDDSRSIDKSGSRKRKASDLKRELVAADTSLRALKKLAVAEVGRVSYSTDGFLSSEEFQRMKELKAKKEAKAALAQHGLSHKPAGFKVSSFDQLSAKPLDPSKLEAHVRRKMSKEDRLAMVREGREDRGKFQARTAMKQNKTGGLSNRQKEHKKKMPLSAKRSKIAKSRQDKRKKKQLSGKQFRGKKAWKN